MRRRVFFAAFALVALLLAGVVSLFASGSPDGLERVAEEQGMAKTEQQHPLGDGPMAEYGIEALDEAGLSALSGGLSGVIGVLVVLALTTALVLVVRRRNAADRGG